MPRSIGKFLMAFCLLLLAITFTWGVVSWSVAQGKLAFPPDYDDSHSLVEGALRLGTWMESGWTGLWKEYQERLPHSFLHYYWATLLFSIFGTEQAMPYWANGLILWAVLWAFSSLLPPVSPGERVLWILAFLGVPVCFHLVHDFRSEVTMAALLFVGAALSLHEAHSRFTRWWRLATIGLVFALALGMKPAMFPYTLGILGLCSLVLLAGAWRRCLRPGVGEGTLAEARLLENGTDGTDGKWRAFFFSAARGEKGGVIWQWLVLWGMAILPVLPHFIFYFDAIFRYILGVVVESEAYHIPKALGAQWSFHWLGYSGVWHLGGLLFLLPIVVTAWLFFGSVAVLFDSRSRPLLRDYLPDWSWFALVFLMLGAFAGMAINAVEQPFFGMTFQLLLAAAGLSGLAWMGHRWPNWLVVAGICAVLGLMFWPVTLNRNFLIPAAVAGALVVGGCWLARWPWTRWASPLLAAFVAVLVWQATQVAPYNNYLERTRIESGPFPEQGLAWRREGPGKIWAILAPLAAETPRPLVWFAGPGWIDGNTVGWEAVQSGIFWKLFNRTDMPVKNPAAIPDSAEVVILAEPGLLGLFQYPTPNVTTPLWQRWSSGELAAAWRVLAEIQDPFGKKLVVLRRSDSD